MFINQKSAHFSEAPLARSSLSMDTEWKPRCLSCFPHVKSLEWMWCAGESTWLSALGGPDGLSLPKWSLTLALRCYTHSGISQGHRRRFASVSSLPEVGHLWTRKDSCADGQLFLVMVVKRCSPGCKVVNVFTVLFISSSSRLDPWRLQARMQLWWWWSTLPSMCVNVETETHLHFHA